jgi:hypothetical protein
MSGTLEGLIIRATKITATGQENRADVVKGEGMDVQEAPNSKACPERKPNGLQHPEKFQISIFKDKSLAVGALNTGRSAFAALRRDRRALATPKPRGRGA